MKLIGVLLVVAGIVGAALNFVDSIESKNAIHQIYFAVGYIVPTLMVVGGSIIGAIMAVCDRLDIIKANTTPNQPPTEQYPSERTI